MTAAAGPCKLNIESFRTKSRKDDSLPTLVLLHGLFGSARNWRALGKRFAGVFGGTVYAMDMRNHGNSPHQSHHSISLMAEDVLLTLDHMRQSEDVSPAGICLLGHSMGGRAAMAAALNGNVPFTKLIVVDTTPIRQRTSLKHVSNVRTQIAAMHAVNAQRLGSLADMHTVLRQHIKERAVREFLLTNFAFDRDEQLYTCRLPLETLQTYVDVEIDAFPFSPGDATYNSPTLFVVGKRSFFVPDASHPEIKKLFPAAEFTSLDTGHWVQAEKPEEFFDIVCKFVRSRSDPRCP
ncbi:Alpha/Beta hydrolase protein [Phlyctochytrium arcticum]|nr:Alpha/Beta hydrolase protein [Phlyctochytrium arcticum]